MLALDSLILVGGSLPRLDLFIQSNWRMLVLQRTVFLQKHSFYFEGTVISRLIDFGKMRFADVFGGGVKEGAGGVVSHAATVSHVFFTLVLCVAITVIPLAVHFVNPKIAILCQFFLVSGLVLFWTPLAPLPVFFALLFQNLFVSLFADFLSDAADYNFIRGYNFLTTMIVWIWLFGQYALNWRGQTRSVNQIMGVCLFGFALIGFYFLLGMAKNPTGAVIYLRNIITPLVLFQIFFLVALRSYRPIMPFFAAITVFMACLGYIELLDRTLWMDLTNGWRLWEVDNRQAVLNLAADKSAKETGYIIRNLFDILSVAFLNTPLLGENSFVILRMHGPNNHPISYSYALGFLAIIMLLSKRWYLALPLYPLMIMASAKGALILQLLAFCALLARKLFGAMFGMIALIVVLALYIVIGIITGLKIGDFHVLGFMGGFYNFLDYPFGNGLGDAGNLVSNFGELDWQAYQHAGRTPIAMESAVGVMLHQMGFATFGLLGVYAWIGFKTFRLSLKSRVNLHSVASFITLIMLVNGIFQEEALFSPLALALIMGLNGHILGTSLRSSIASK